MGLIRARIGKSEKALVALAAISLALWLFQSFFPALVGFRQFALALLLILAGLFATRRAVDLGQWAARKILWRVRHRMIAVFFFVGVLPISIGALLVVWGVVLVFGPLATFMITSQVVTYSERMEAAAEPLVWLLEETPADQRRTIVEAFHENAGKVFPGLVLLTDFDGTRESFPDTALSGAVPSKLLAEPGLVRKGEDVFIATAVEGEAAGGRVVAAVPVTAQLLRKMMPGLGVLLVQVGELDPGGQRPVPLTVSEVFPDEPADDRIDIPPPMHPLDWQINWLLQRNMLDWDSNRIESTTYLLRTRLSALWGKVFAQESDLTTQVFSIVGYALIAAFCANLLFSLFIAASLTRTLTRAVNDLYVGTMHVNRGDFGYRIPVWGNDQLSDLSRSFNAMTASIRSLIEESKRRLQLEAELEIAREVQSGLFPSEAPSVDGLEILGVCRPARSVSGDFYEYVRLDGDRLAISFGDVSGKGISAALVMASLHSIMRAQLSLLRKDERRELASAAPLVVRRANLQLCEGTSPEKFSTLFFGAYDHSTEVLAYCNAGHLPPLLIRNGEIRPLAVNGMVVGAFPFATYTADTLRLESGDLLVAFTDGLTEPENESGEEYGEKRLQRSLQSAAHVPTTELIERVMDDVVAWTGAETLQDDMTMLVVRKR